MCWLVSLEEIRLPARICRRSKGPNRYRKRCLFIDTRGQHYASARTASLFFGTLVFVLCAAVASVLTQRLFTVMDNISFRIRDVLVVPIPFTVKNPDESVPYTCRSMEIIPDNHLNEILFLPEPLARSLTLETEDRAYLAYC